MIESATKRSAAQASAWAYILAHWRGDLPLALSFWVNLVLLRLVLYFLAALTHPPFMADPYAAAIASILFIAFAHVGVFAWQIVGVVRACDRYQAVEGAIIPVYGVYFGIAVTLLFTLSSAFTAVQTTFVEPKASLLNLIWQQERDARYSLRLSPDGRTLHLDGSFEHGMTEKLKDMLAQNNGVVRIVLASSGGYIFEGRGVGKLIADRGLDTHVDGSCYSACARAFISGTERTVAPVAKEGFHRYRLDAVNPVPFVDVDTEQDTDRSFYRARGVSDAFLARMFEAVQPDLWVPPVMLLVKSGVAHRVMPAPSQ